MKRTVLLILLFAFACVTKTTTGPDAFSYTDGESFRVQIPLANKDGSKSKKEGTVTHEFREKPAEDSVIVRVIVLETKSPEDLFAPGYESSFLSSCNCSVGKRGVIHVNTWAAREYVLSMKDGSRIAYERHIAVGKKIFVLGVFGPSDDDARLASMFKTLTESFAIKE